jgi:RES domain-containing protein
MKHVCASCFDDEDLQGWIASNEGDPGCDFCDDDDAPTCELDDLCEYMTDRIKQVFGFAVEQLPYESAEGGYQGRTWTTYEVLVEELGISLPRDRDDILFYALLHGLPDEAWCDYDWLRLDLDEALRSSWGRFCEEVKYKRRFFFQGAEAETEREHEDDDSFSPGRLLRTIAEISQDTGLVRMVPVDAAGLSRARTNLAAGQPFEATDFGPPPRERATQSNRMNPPGIPMLYLASSAVTALRETRIPAAMVGRWVATRPLRILDLRKLPDVPGIFSAAERDERLAVSFLYDFADDIMQPVARDERVHIDYLPSQVVSEFVRDYAFRDGKLDGVAYGSTVHPDGWNLALFLERADLGLDEPDWWQADLQPSMQFAGAEWVAE